MSTALKLKPYPGIQLVGQASIEKNGIPLMKQERHPWQL
jgi:hypothetical protein